MSQGHIEFGAHGTLYAAKGLDTDGDQELWMEDYCGGELSFYLDKQEAIGLILFLMQQFGLEEVSR